MPSAITGRMTRFSGFRYSRRSRRVVLLPVRNRTDDGGEHTDLGKALCGDKGVHAHHQQHKDRAQNVDAAVVQRIGQGDVTGTKEPQQHRRTGVEAQGEHHRKEHQDGKAVGNDLFCLLLVTLPHGDGGAGSAACAYQHGKGVQQHEDGGKKSHAGKGGCADAGNVSDVDAVYDVVQQVYHLRHNGRDHQLQHQFFYAAGPHVLSGLCHEIGLLWFK